ncbi:MAG: phage portal protein [Pseudomonadota bacterium]
MLEKLARLWPRRAAAAREQKAAYGSFVAIEGLATPAWGPRNYAAFARDGMMHNAIVYRSVRMISEAAVSVPLSAYQGDNEVEEHPILDLIFRSPLNNGTELLEQIYGYLLVAGNAYINALSVGGQLNALHTLRPDRVRVIVDSDGWPEAYEYTVSTQRSILRGEAVPGVAKVLHLKLFHPANDHYGLSPLEAAATAIDAHNTASRWNKALLDNAARPSGALIYQTGGHLTAEQFNRLKGELEENFQGACNAGRPLLLEGGLDWKSMGLTPRDMDFMEAKNGAAREIALALGVPPMLLGIPGDNTYANYQEANRTFWRQTVLPLVTRTARMLSAWLQPAWGDGTELRPDIDAIEALNSEREALWMRLEKVNFLSLNEKRAATGYGPVEQGDSI